MHGLGHVGRAEINDDTAGGLHRRNSEPCIHQQVPEASGKGIHLNPEIKKARTGDLHISKVRNLGSLCHGLCQSPGILPRLLGQHHRGIGLVVPKAEIGRLGHPDLPKVLAIDPASRKPCPQAFLQCLSQCHARCLVHPSRAGSWSLLLPATEED